MSIELHFPPAGVSGIALYDKVKALSFGLNFPPAGVSGIAPYNKIKVWI